MNETERKSLLKKAKEVWQNGFLASAKEMINQVISENPKDQEAQRILTSLNNQEKESYLSTLEQELKDVLAANKLDKAESIIEELANNHHHEIADKARKILTKKRIEECILAIKQHIKSENWEVAQIKANELMSLKWNHRTALLAFHKIGKIKKRDWKTLIEVQKPEDHCEIKRLSLKLFIFIMVFIALSGLIIYSVSVDEKNILFEPLDQKNIAVQLAEAENKLSSIKKEIQATEKTIELLKENQDEKTILFIKEVMNERFDWSQLIDIIEEITTRVYPQNKIDQNINYYAYDYDKKSGKLEIKGYLKDSDGKNLTKIAELEEAFKYYPGTKVSPSDSIYFERFENLETLEKKRDQETDEFKSAFHFLMFIKSAENQSIDPLI